MPMRVPRLAALRAPSASASLIAPARLIVSAAPVSRNATRSFVTSSSRTKPASESIQIGQKNLVTGEITGAVDIDPARLVIEHNATPKSLPDPSTLVFGKTFTDHMLTVPWSSKSGWGAPKISPYAPLQLDPSSTVLHYAPCLFEGMKAYKDENGVARLFRPDKNMERMNRSAARLAFPTFTGEHLTTLIKKLVEIDSQWIPTGPGMSMYIRPTMIGTQAGLGVGASTEILLFVIMSPVGPYYKTGFKPVGLLATSESVRAWPGGTGGYKLGSNYAGGVVPQMQAAELGYQQILWLFGPEHRLTEAGTMNLFTTITHPDGTVELITPPLEDMVLPGVTRDSIMSLCAAHNDPSTSFKIEGLPETIKVTERSMTMSEIVAASKDGTLSEMFGSGTAAIVSPVDRIGYEGKDIAVPCGADGLGDIARVMLREIVGRQNGTIKSDWSVPV